MEKFQLRAELHGHEEDVRGLCVCDLGLVTVSRDKMAKLWVEHGDQSFACSTTLVGHTDYVNTAAYLPPGASTLLPQGALVTGSRDNTIILWDMQAAAPVQVLEGHKYQVTDVAVGPEGSVVSCSLDATIRVWQEGKCVKVLEGHEGPVQCLVQLPTGQLLSGSNDSTVKVWEDGQCVRTIRAHGDTVRGMAVVPGIGVVTASHDHSAKVWTAGGDLVAELVGHTAILYAAAASPGGDLVATASEDNTVRLWQLDGMCVQEIEHPANVWDVAFLPNGDLVTACADFVARVWTRDSGRVAPQDVKEAYAAAMAARREAAAAGSSQGGGSGLPAGLKLEDASALLVPGAKDGQTKIVREGGGAVAYGWSAASGQWEKIGEVMGGNDDTMAAGNKMFGGQAYDFVFDVDVEDGAPPRKLPINRGDNPYDAADNFILRENLPQTYREQIVHFILQNTGGAVSLPAIPSNVDPFTGGGAYVPRGAAFNPGPPARGAAAGAGFSDPFTGAGAYVPRSGTGPAAPAAGGGGSFPVTGGGVDPFTGATARTPALVPRRGYMVFDNVPKMDGVASKIRELSAALAQAPDTAQLAVPEQEAGTVDALLAKAAAAASGSAGLSAAESALLSRLLRWPAGQLFPALDVVRLLALNQAAAGQLAAMLGSWGDAGEAPAGRAGLQQQGSGSMCAHSDWNGQLGQQWHPRQCLSNEDR